MRLSKNELTVTVRKAFEGLGFGAGEGEDAAGMVAWLELHGLGGLRELDKALTYLEREGKSRLAERYCAPGLRVLDAGGASILCGGGLAVDAGVAMARAEGIGIVRIDACHNRALTVGYLARAVRRGVGVLATWHNGGEPGTRWMVAQGAGDDWPAVRLFRPDRAPDHAGGRHLTLWFAKDVNLLPQLHPAVSGRRILLSADPAALAQRHREGIEHGLAVDGELWERVRRLAARVLVESDGCSRGDAGGGADG